MTTSENTPKTRWQTELWLVLSCLVLFVIVDNQSFWIDETCAAIYAQQASFSRLVGFAKFDTLAEPLQPLSVLCNWGWARVFGAGEWTLRAQNIVWGFLGLLGLYRTARITNIPWLPALMVIQPFFWFYTNELRPYAEQMAISCWLLLGVSMVVSDRRFTSKAWAILILSSLALAFTSVLALFTLAPLWTLLFLAAWKRRWSLRPMPIFLLAGSAVIFVLLYGYYYVIVKQGSGGVRMWTVTPLNLGYILYEFTGLSGLGPPLANIREFHRAGQLRELFATYLPHFALAGLLFTLLVLVGAAGYRKLWKNGSADLTTLCGLLVISLTLLLFGIGMAAQKAFWARHLSPVLGFYVFGLAACLQAGWSVKILRAISFGLIALLIASSLSFGFSPVHAKDDVRGAAQNAQRALAEGKTVWWCGEWRAANVYGLPVTIFAQVTDPHFAVTGPEAERFSQLPQPDIVFFSNREFFHSREPVKEALARMGLTKSTMEGGFIVFQRP